MVHVTCSARSYIKLIDAVLDVCMPFSIILLQIVLKYACRNSPYRMMTSYIKGTARVVNRVPTLRLGQVR